MGIQRGRKPMSKERLLRFVLRKFKGVLIFRSQYDRPFVKTRCAAAVHDDFGVGFHQCVRGPKFNLDRFRFCSQHYQIELAARRAEGP